MAHSLPLIAPNTFVLKLILRCTRLENSLKRLLSKVRGVQSVAIDSKQGTITISGTVESATIVTLLRTFGGKAEVLREPRPSKDNNQNLQILEQSEVVDHQFNDPHLVAQLQQLSEIKDLKHVEVTHSKTIRLTLEGQQNDSTDKTVEITIWDGAQSPQIYHSGGLCTASAPCSGGYLAVNTNLHGSCGSCQIHAVGQYWPPQYACGSVPPGPPPPWPGCSPSPPPLGFVCYLPQTSSGHPPPVMGFSSVFSGENPAGGWSYMNLP